MDVDYPDPTGIGSLDRWLEELVDGLRYPAFDMEQLTVSGNVTLNQGTIAGVEVSESQLTIKEGGNITLEDGSDINLESGGDINFAGSTYTSSINSNATGSEVYFEPDTASEVNFTIGKTNLCNLIGLYSDINITCQVILDANHHAAIELAGDSGDPIIRHHLKSGGTTKYLQMYYDSTSGSFYFGPLSDGDADIGRSSYTFYGIFGNELNLKEVSSSPSNVSNFGQIYTKSDNELYFIDGDGTEYTIDKTAT